MGYRQWGADLKDGWQPANMGKIELPHDCRLSLFPCSCPHTDDFYRVDPEKEDDDDEEPDPYADVEEEDDLGDLYDLGLSLFNIWSGGAELEWAACMWSILEKAGLTAYDGGDEVQRTLVVCRLVTLAGINLEFAARAWDEGTPSEWREALYVDIVGDYPRLDAVALGRLAERNGVWADGYEERESVDGLVHAIAESEWRTVVAALVNELSDSFFFASLWRTRDGDARYPLPEEVISEAVNADTWEKVEAYQWVSDGCPPNARMDLRSYDIWRGRQLTLRTARPR